jgi:hypothetical protein
VNAIIVCVDYADILAVTLPYNRHHFDRVTVVTTPEDYRTCNVCSEWQTGVHCTRAFYARGASFNKWAALEEGLDTLGRKGWLCILDADVLLPKDADLTGGRLRPGLLYGPLRRNLDNPPIPFTVPPEERWGEYPLHRVLHEWSGYCQVFHASDPHLGAPPWHQTDWRHAGGADSFFQAKWQPHERVRFPWQVLHIGLGGANWCGRVTPSIADGSVPDAAPRRAETLRGFMRGRRRHLADPYSHEKLPPE